MAATQRFFGAAPSRACAARAQSLQRPELELLDCALGPSEFLCDVANAFLFDETFDDDGPLVGRKIIDQPEQNDAAFNIRPMRLIEVVGSVMDRFS